MEISNKPHGQVVTMKPARMAWRSLLQRFFQCLGLSSIILVMNYGDLLGGGADVRMHLPHQLRGILLAQIADIVVLGFVLFLFLGPTQRTRFYPWLRLVTAIVMPPYILWRMRSLIPVLQYDNSVPVLFAVWTALLLLLMLRARKWFNVVMRVGDAVGIFLAAWAIFSIVSLIWVMHWEPPPRDINAAWESTKEPQRDHPKIVWIIFDELSYDQVFEHRAHDLLLPNFDKLRTISTIFSDSQPIDRFTVRVIPSLFSGKVVDDYRYRFDNTFVVHYKGERGWHPLEGSNSIFHDAKMAGYRTAAIGWYNPYCTIYGDAIDQCYWNNEDRIDGLMSQRDSFKRNAWTPLEQVVREIRAPDHAEREACNYDVKQRLKTHLDLEKHWMQLLTTDQADFVYLHLPIPHSPNIWSRARDNYVQVCESSYLDSLALADRELGIVLNELQASPRWKDTTLIVQGDHSWRTDIWNPQSAWTDEDEIASRGDIYDPRPAIIIHSPSQTGPGTVTQSWSVLNIHTVLEQILHGQPVQY